MADISAPPAGGPAPQETHGTPAGSGPHAREGGRAPTRLTVLAGPTAVGKGTVSADVRARYPQVWLSVSATTRPPRPGEVNGVHYLFVSPQEFDRMVADGEMLESAVVHGRHRYGTPRGPVEDHLGAGVPTLLEIDLQGARQVRDAVRAMGLAAQFVFLSPPSFDELVRRLVGRGTESVEERERRLATAEVEMAAEPEFDVTIVNDDVTRATDELAHVMGVTSATPQTTR